MRSFARFALAAVAGIAFAVLGAGAAQADDTATPDTTQSTPTTLSHPWT
ncbi:hypothetical protein KZ829_05965 [Actinoplanes hulinensis]|uniref:Uncharacterized protein n=1 Tax=Actinoplanes hulinensis TaxID=1144547 RepID=A0ABS7AWZ3_9ACTN|nr:hypothetical protein [Actinoplanes hulinensis]MBW6433288.1 hypothetical protein [Actinoplanes hulinensis]